MRPVLDVLSPADHYKLRDAVEARWAPYVAPDGSVAIPGRALGVVAEA
jgi:riboflavin synthase alpha subunit